MIKYIDLNNLNSIIPCSREKVNLPQRFDRYFNTDKYNVVFIYGALPVPKSDKSIQIVEAIKKLVDPKYYIIFDFSSESYPADDFDWFKNELTEYKTYLIQSGLIDPPRLDIFNSYIYFISSFTELPPFNKRTHRYSSLNRLIRLRDQRLIFAYELYKIGILDKGLISLGSGEPEGIAQEYVSKISTFSKEFKNKVPLYVDGIQLSRNGPSNPDHIHNPGADAVFNVVAESSINDQESMLHPELTYNHGWNAYHFSEKTAKAFNCKQIPIFLAPYGYVSKLRQLGFDMFDDIVDHTYDTIKANDGRISMLALELKRLIQDNNFKKVVSNYHNLNLRLEHNRNNIDRVKKEGYNQFLIEVERVIQKSEL